MNRLICGLLSPLLALLALGFAGSAAALVITYQATDLPDVPGPGDRWQYSYNVVSGSFGPGGGFNVLFSPLLYASLEPSTPQAVGDWSVVVVAQPVPDPVNPADGLYSAVANIPNPSLAATFVVTFDWLGAGTPGAQTFEVFDETGFLPSEGGSTTQAVGQAPLPGTLALVALGLLALRARSAVTQAS